MNISCFFSGWRRCFLRARSRGGSIGGKKSVRPPFLLDAVVCMPKIHDETYFDELIAANVGVIQVTATDEDEDGFDGTLRNFSRWHDTIARRKDRMMLIRSAA